VIKISRTFDPVEIVTPENHKLLSTGLFILLDVGNIAQEGNVKVDGVKKEYPILACSHFGATFPSWQVG